MKIGSPEYISWEKAAGDKAWLEETTDQLEEYNAAHEDESVKFRYFFYDASHGWLQVDRRELISLEIEDKITVFSYQKDHLVFLEEDLDMGVYIDAHGENWKDILHIRNVDDGLSSRIRTYQSYSL